MKLELKNATFSIDDVLILQNINLCVPEGSTSFIIGKSGTGKSSLLKAFAGLIPFDHGELYCNGQRFDTFSIAEENSFRAKSGFAFENAALWSNKSVLENICLPLSLHEPKTHRKTHEDTAKRLLREYGYTDSVKLRPAGISTGEKKIVGFCRSIVLDPQLLFLDNPTVSIDTDSERKIINYIESQKNTEKTIMIASNKPQLIRRLADFIIVMGKGEILAADSCSKILESDNINIKAILDSFFSESI